MPHAKGAVVSLDLATRSDLIEVHPTKDLTLIQMNDKSAIPPQFKKYPLAVSKTGNWTGRLMNIGDYCLQKLGKAFNQRQADALRIAGKVVPVASEAERKSLSAELDNIRKHYFADAKAYHAALSSRDDVQVTSLAIRPNAKGFAITARSQLFTNRETEADVLRKELEDAKLQLAELKKHVPKGVAAKIEKKAHETIEAETSVTHSPSTAEPQSGSPAPKAPEAPKDGVKEPVAA